MDLRDLLTVTLNQDISNLVREDAVGRDFQLGYQAGMRRAIEILEPETITYPLTSDKLKEVLERIRRQTELDSGSGGGSGSGGC